MLSIQDYGYEMLQPERIATVGMHGRVLRLDDPGNNLVRTLGRQNGNDCSTCAGGGTITNGFQASVIGVLQQQHGNDNDDLPPVIAVTDARLGSCEENGWQAFVPAFVSFESGSVGTGLDPIVLHGGCMALAWGVLLPIGILSAIFRRRDDDASDWWFKVHRTCNSLGVLLTAIGIAIAFAKFDHVFTDGMGPSYRQGVMGITTATLAAVQVINALLRPHKTTTTAANSNADTTKEDKLEPTSDAEISAVDSPQPKETESVARVVSETGHKNLGYMAIGLAYPTMYFGTQVTGSRQQSFERFFLVLIGFAVVVAGCMMRNRMTMQQRSKQQQRTTSSSAPNEQV